MQNNAQNWSLIVAASLVGLAIAGCAVLFITGHQDSVDAFVKACLALIGLVVGFMVKNASDTNVANQAKISKQADVIETKANVGIEQNKAIIDKGETIVAKVDAVKQLVNGTEPVKK